MAVHIYYVLNDGSDRWSVRLNEAASATACKDRDDAVITARRYAARDYRNGFCAQVRVQSAFGFELEWCMGWPAEPHAK